VAATGTLLTSTLDQELEHDGTAQQHGGDKYSASHSNKQLSLSQGVTVMTFDI
jgi:hypothetical protein